MKIGIPELIQDLIDLLERHGEEQWGASLRRLFREFESNPNTAAANIRSLYGGMGSFSDVVLQDKTGPLRSANEELDRLRSELFSSCSR